MYKIGLQRTDLKVTADGEPIKPGLALGSWMAFKRTGDHAMVMGDLVLLESEITPVLSKLEDNGIEISAIHNHILNEQPRVMYMHYMGHGDEEKLARAMKEALTLSGTPMGPPPSASPAASTFDWSKVQEALGIKGNERGVVLAGGVLSCCTATVSLAVSIAAMCRGENAAAPIMPITITMNPAIYLRLT